MKKKVILLLILVFSIIAIFSLVKIDKPSLKNQSERPTNVPLNSVWSGGYDGGYWFNFIDYNVAKKEYYFIIYNENDGTIIFEGNFIKNPECGNELSITKDILREINYYANEEIILIGGCSLLKR